MDGSQKTTICRICEQPEHSVQVFMKQWLCIKGDLWFQTKVEEDISNRFKMLDISNRFKIWDFKYILNVDLWLHSFKSSKSYNDTNTLCKCSWSDAIVSKVISGFRQKWRKVTASCGGLLWKLEVDEKVHEDALIWDLKVIKVESPDQWQQHHGSLCWGMEQQKEKSMSTVSLPNWWLDSR
jgi:hypothetical protein